MSEFEREILTLLKSIDKRLEEQNKLLQVIADKPSYSSKPQKPMLGNAYLSEEVFCGLNPPPYSVKIVSPIKKRARD